MGLLSSSEASRLVSLTHAVTRLPSLEGIGIYEVWQALIRDKKFRAGRIRMVLLSRLGETVIRSDIDPVHLRRFLRRFLQHRGRLQS
jgi:3-dehydroquinate synthetase